MPHSQPVTGTHKDQERLKDIEELSCPCFITSLQGLLDDIDHGGDQILEGFLNHWLSEVTYNPIT